MWTGKQLVSCIVPKGVDIVKNSTASMDDLLGPQGLVIIRGDMLAGRLNKMYLGAANTGLVHAVWRSFGPGGAHKFISDAQRLFVKHLMHDGPSQSVVDCLMGSSDTDTAVSILSRHLGRSDAVLTLDLPPEVRELKASSILQETLRAVGSDILAKVRPESALANCVNSGSKGNVMNIAQIGGCVGQQTVYGQRVPLRRTRLGPRTLVYYAPGDLRAEARGFVSNSYVSGLSPAEFFVHQMAGREGIVATAVNTSESGYNQRRMIKGQESQCMGYDGTVRVSSNIIIQSYYGGDDLDGSRLERVRLPWIFNDSEALGIVAMCLKKVRQFATWRANLYKDMDLSFPCAVAIGPLVASRTEGHDDIIDDLFKQCMSLHCRHHSAKSSMLNISVAVLVLQAYEHRNVLRRTDIALFVNLYRKALVAAGEGVGALGASSIGEPSMQMTLNVFHYSGIADKNVTISGLPRFKQLINGVDTYDTANMTAALRSYEDTASAIEVSTVMLRDVIESLTWSTEAPHPGFAVYGAARGPFYAKFGQDSAAACVRAVIKLSWQKCARRSVDTSAVARALRDTLGYDAIVVAQPHWHDASISVVFAPWIAHANVIAEGLQAQLQVRGILYCKNAIVFQEKRYSTTVSSRHVVETEGSNLLDLVKCEFLVPETARTTNVVEVCNVLGISAGTAVLQAELHRVLAFDSSYIDPRHTWLLADTMGRSGSLAAMNRHHMETLGSSLLQRASFEQSLDVFEEGAAFGRSDPLAGATERIITGQPVSIGTGIMGIVSESMAQGPEILIGPMPTDSGDDVVVRPINFKSQLFDPTAFGLRLSDTDRVCTDAFLEQCAACFRFSAAAKRLVPKIRLTTKLSDSRYKSTLAQLWAYGQWTETSSTQLVTEVHWQFGDSAAVTRISENFKSVSESIDTFNTETQGRYTCDIFASRVLDPQEITTFGTEATKVIMQSQAVFTKGSFSLTMARQWIGNTNVEVERLMLTEHGSTVAILESVDPEDILQNRCSDAQLGNALAARMP